MGKSITFAVLRRSVFALAFFVLGACEAPVSQEKANPYSTNQGQLETAEEIQNLLNEALPGMTVELPVGSWEGDWVVPAGVTLSGVTAAETQLQGTLTVGEGAEVHRIHILAPQVAAGGLPQVGVVGSSGTLAQLKLSGWDVAVQMAPEEGELRIVRCFFDRNGVGVQVGGLGMTRIESSVFSSHDLSGVQCSVGGMMSVLGNTFYGSSQGGTGAQISLESIGCLGSVVGNVVMEGVRGLFCDSCPAEIHSNVVYGHEVTTQGVLGNNLFLNPQLTNPGEGDFRPAPGSPGINTVSGEGPELDFEGRPRNVGQWTAGAFVAREKALLLQWEEVRVQPLFLEVLVVSDAPVLLESIALSDGDAVDFGVLSEAPAPVEEGAEGDEEDGGTEPSDEEDGGTEPSDEEDGDVGDATDVVEPEPPVALPGDRIVFVDEEWDGEIPSGVHVLMAADGQWGDGVGPMDTLALQVGTVETEEFQPPKRWLGGASWVRDGDHWAPSVCPSLPGDNGCEPGPQVSPFVITEVMEDGPNSFIEIENRTDTPIFLTDFVLGSSSEAGVQGTSAQPKVMPGGRGVYVEEGGLILQGVSDGVGRCVLPPSALAEALKWGATSVALFDLEGNWIDAPLWAPSAPEGVSVEVLDSELGGRQGNWGPSGCSVPHTAGADRCAQGWEAASLVLREVLLNAEDENRGRFVELLNLGAFPVNLSGWSLVSDEYIRPLVGLEPDSQLFPGGRALLVAHDGAEDWDPGLGGVVMVPQGSKSFPLPFAVEQGLSLLNETGARVVDALQIHVPQNNGQSVQNGGPIGDSPTVNWAASLCPEGPTPGGDHCESVESFGVVNIVEVSLEPLNLEERFVELFNPTGIPLNLMGWTLQWAGDSMGFTATGGQGMILQPFSRGLVVGEEFDFDGGPTLLADEDFEDGAVGVENWTLLADGDPLNTLVEHGGRLVGTLEGQGAIGVVTKDPLGYAVRGMWVETELEMPFGPGETVRGIVHLGSTKEGVPSQMEQFIQLRFQNEGIHHNVEVLQQTQGGAPEKLWSWQEVPFCCPSQTQTLRMYVDSQSVKVYYGPEESDLLVDTPHSLDPASFPEGHLFVGFEADGPLSEPYEGSFDFVEAWRPPLEVGEDALRLVLESPGFGDIASWGDVLGWENGDGANWPGGGAPWKGTSMEKELLSGDAGEDWHAAPCGPTPGSESCESEALYVGAWWEHRLEDGFKAWKRIIGIPTSLETCDSVWSCANQGTLGENLPAQEPFWFHNPYVEQVVRFEARNGALAGCGESCLSVEVIEIQPGESAIIPQSPGGFYFVETHPGVSNNPFGLSGWAFPPPEAVLSTFATRGAP